MQTLYIQLTKPSNGTLSEDYLKNIREYETFSSVFSIKDSNPEDEENPLSTLGKYKFHFIQYIVYAYSKESPYNKMSDTLLTIQKKICSDLKIPNEIMNLIIEFKIPELEESIANFINRETDELVQQYLTARQIHSLNMRLSSSTIDRTTGSLIEPKMQMQYYETAEKFQLKMYEIKQQFTSRNHNFMEFVNDFRKKTESKGLHIEDVIPM